MWNWESRSYGFDTVKVNKDDKKEIETQFDTVGLALAYAMKQGYSTGFIIVQVVDWEKLK